MESTIPPSDTITNSGDNNASILPSSSSSSSSSDEPEQILSLGEELA